MSLYHAFELILVAAAVAGSAYLALLRLSPQRFGRKRTSSNTSCSSCSSCGGCGSNAPAPAPEQPVHWRR